MSTQTESVWDYPRPPALERTPKRLEVVFADRVIADTTQGFRVLETSHPPVYYIPPSDIDAAWVRAAAGSSFCEWKGAARYVDIVVDDRVAAQAGWYYPAPTAEFTPIAGYIAFYGGRVDECRVDGEVVSPQPGGFYGGWITHDVTGPFKGEPGTQGW